MATLTNTQISVTYVGLLKTSANTVLTSTAQQITDGSGNNSILYLSTAGVGIGGSPASGKELDVTGNVQVTGDLIVDNITIDGSTITNASGDLTIVNTTDDGDILLQTDDGSGGTTTYLQLDGGSVIVQLKKDLYALDNVRIRAGNSGDLQIYHDATDSYIENDTGDLTIVNRADDKDIIFQSDDGSGGVATYLTLDGSTTKVNFSKSVDFAESINIADSRNINLGDGGDLQIVHNSTNSFIENNTGDLTLQNNADDKDIVFKTDDGSGGVTEYFRLDGSAEVNVFSKNITLSGSHTIKNDSNGNLDIRTTVSNKQIFIKAQGSLRLDSGDAQALTLDTSQDASFTGNVSLADSKSLNIGSGNDLQIFHDGSNSSIQNITGDLNIFTDSGNMFIYNNATDGDISFQTDNGSGGTTEYMRLDGGITSIVTSKDILMGVDGDGGKLKLGAGQDLVLFANGTNSFITNETGNLHIIQNVDDGDLIFESDDGSGGTTEYIRLDGGEAINVFSRKARFLDNVQASFGTADDFKISHDGSATYVQNVTSHLIIENQADDSDIIFKSDDGSGGTATYFFLDGSQLRTTFNKEARFIDSTKLKFGDSGDLEIFHDGSNSFISDQGTGTLKILSNGVEIKNAGDSGFMAFFGATGASELYFNTAKKFETTSTGATVTGDLGITGSLSKGSGSFKIDHPVKEDTHYLYHSFVESPLTDLIYRGKTKLANGKGTINIDRHFGMTEGTFVALVDDKQVFTTNEDTWDTVRGKIEGSELHIECQNKEFNGYVSWLVIGDRKDKHIMEVDWTDDKGKPILEIEKLN